MGFTNAGRKATARFCVFHVPRPGRPRYHHARRTGLPTWAGAWHVREAQTHGIHGAVALSDADPFVIHALRRAGIPVLALELDNYNPGDNTQDAIDRQIAAFLESLESGP